MSVVEPKTFKRGATFNVTMALPSYVVAGHFADWTATAQVRRFEDDSARGLLADLVFEWIDPLQALSFTLTADETADWPLGLAEFDVMFEKDGRKVRTRTTQIRVKRGITQ
jgi:hypothetical protein